MKTQETPTIINNSNGGFIVNYLCHRFTANIDAKGKITISGRNLKREWKNTIKLQIAEENKLEIESKHKAHEQDKWLKKVTSSIITIPWSN